MAVLNKLCNYQCVAINVWLPNRRLACEKLNVFSNLTHKGYRVVENLKARKDPLLRDQRHAVSIISFEVIVEL